MKQPRSLGNLGGQAVGSVAASDLMRIPAVLTQALLLAVASLGPAAILSTPAVAQYAAGGGNATGPNTIAVGTGSVANGSGAVAVGVNSNVSNIAGGSTHGVAIGDSAKAISSAAAGSSPIAIGVRANASGAGSQVAIGDQTIASGKNAISIGGNAFTAGTKATGDYSTAIGAGASATGVDSLAFGGGGVLGSGAQATASNALSIGAGSKALAATALALGGADATAEGGAAVTAATAGSSATGIRSLAIGTGTMASGASSIAQGDGASAVNANDIAIGTDATATGTIGTGSALAIGNGNKATGAGAVAIGNPSVANGQGAFAAGFNSIATADGTAGGAAANGAIAIGNTAISAGEGSVSIGNTTRAGAVGSVALGDTATTTVANSVALGSGSTITAAPTGAAFNTATAAPAIQVEVGGRRITGVSGGSAGTDAINVSQLTGVAGNLAGTVNGSFNSAGVYTAPTFTTADGTTASTVQGALTNETAGITNLGSSVATNQGGGATYNSAIGAVSAPAFRVASINAAGMVGAPTAAVDSTTAFGGLTTSVDNLANTINAGTVGPIQRTATLDVLTAVAAGGTAAAPGTAQKLTNIAPATLSGTSTDAVNGSQLFATNGNVTTLTTTLGSLGSTTATALGGGSTYTASTGVLSAPSYTVATIAPGGALGGPTTQTSVGGAVTSLSNDVTNLAGSVASGTAGLVQQTGGAPGTGQITVGAGTQGTGVSFANSTSATRTLTGVSVGALGAASTDAINGSQLFATNQILAATGLIAANSVQYDSAGKTSATLGGTMSANGGVTNGTTLTNLHQGALSTTSTDAVNGSQLFATNSSISNLASSLANGTVGPVQQSGAANTLNLVAAGATGVAPGTPQTLDNVADGTVAAGSHQAVNGEQLFALAGIAAASTSIQRTATPDRLVVVAAGATAAAPGNAQTIGNIAAGQIATASTDAVNGSQLYATNQNVAVAQTTAHQAAVVDQALAASLGGGAAYDPATGAYTGPSYTIQGTAQTTIGGALALLDARVSTINPIGSFQANNATVGAAASAAGKDSTAAGYGSVASGAGSVAVGNRAQASGSNSVALGTGSTDGGAPNVVSVGAPGSERRITNVAPGIAGTDAVNVDQLNAFGSGVLSAANSYTNRQFAVLDSLLSTKINRAAAGGAALAGVPQAVIPGKGFLGAGVGGRGDQVSFAVGMSTVRDDQYNTTFKAGAALDTRGGYVSYNAGVGFHF